MRFFASDCTPKGRWRVLYKPPVEKRVADLQWRIIHAAIAMNKHRAHLVSSTRKGCPFHAQRETLERGVALCPRLVGLFRGLHKWMVALEGKFSVILFVRGPKYTENKRLTLVLVIFLFGTAKLAIRKTRKNQMVGQCWTDVVQSLKDLVVARLRIEHDFSALTSTVRDQTDFMLTEQNWFIGP